MTFKDHQEAIDYIKANKAPSANILKAREQEIELSALIDGENFIEELVDRIEHLESKDKIKARKKYSRDIQHFFERLLQPLSNVFSSTGGEKRYEISSESQRADLVTRISELKNGKSVQAYVEEKWMPLYHSDPNGLIFMEYSSEKDEVYPTYASIHSIRSYEPRGQLLEVLLFEPKITPDGSLWRIVDDANDWTFLERGGVFIFQEDESFSHPFGEVPALINSNLERPKNNIRISPISRIIGTSKEFARDQSVKTLYKFLLGLPKHWKYASFCKTCKGVGKSGNDSCKDCNGKGILQRNDVTDELVAPIPTNKDQPIINQFAGFISPDLQTWTKYSEELDDLFKEANFTHWGSHVESGKNETATGRWIDVQPVMNKLNKYANVAEFVEFKITFWIYKYINPSGDSSVININYGRRYIIEPPGMLLDNYTKAKKEGANITILDRMLNEYITSKYKNTPALLREELLKSRVEPFVHMGVVDVDDIFGKEEALKKEMFTEWWPMADKSKEADMLRDEYEKWFTEQTAEDPDDKQVDKLTLEAQSKLKGSVGGVTGAIEMFTALGEGRITEAAVRTLLRVNYGFSPEDIEEMLKNNQNTQ